MSVADEDYALDALSAPAFKDKDGRTISQLQAESIRRRFEKKYGVSFSRLQFDDYIYRAAHCCGSDNHVRVMAFESAIEHFDVPTTYTAKEYICFRCGRFVPEYV